MNVIGFNKNIKRGMSGKNDGLDYFYLYEDEKMQKAYRPLKKKKIRPNFSREHKYFTSTDD